MPAAAEEVAHRIRTPQLSCPLRSVGVKMVATLVNPRHDLAIDVDCALRDATAKSGSATLLHDADLSAYNSFDNPDKVTDQTARGCGERSSFTASRCRQRCRLRRSR